MGAHPVDETVTFDSLPRLDVGTLVMCNNGSGCEVGFLMKIGLESFSILESSIWKPRSWDWLRDNHRHKFFVHVGHDGQPVVPRGRSVHNPE